MNPTKTRNVGRSFETRVAKARQINDQPKLMSIPEAAAVIRVGRSKMWSLVWSGDIKSVFVGRQRRVVAASLDSYIKSLQDELMTDIVKQLREAIKDEEAASHLSITIMHFTNEFGRALLAEIERLQAENESLRANQKEILPPG